MRERLLTMRLSTLSRSRRWLSIALCCLPGMTAAALLGLSFATGGAALGAALGGRLGLTVLALIALTCPLIMMVIMARAGQQPGRLRSSGQTACCAPPETGASDPSLTALQSDTTRGPDVERRHEVPMD